ncbi:MAG: hypothetical protein E7256_12620 [Lachnospiraceae bacterium]|nr:hypothetical protein [Lachnospiraceae bacterium]
MELLGNNEIPIGFSMALAKDTNAMNAFSTMPQPEREGVIAHSRTIHSKDEMDHFVSSLSSNSHQLW